MYHTFHDEVELYKTHWWKCDGPCARKPPFYGFVKRPMNRAPGPNDRWWGQHQQTCGGTFIKVKEPEGYGQKKSKKKQENKTVGGKASNDIRKFFGGTGKENQDNNRPTLKTKLPKDLLDANEVRRPGTSGAVSGGSKRGVGSNVTGFSGAGQGPRAAGGGTSRSAGGPGVSGGGGRGNIFGFGGTSFSGVSGGLKNRGKTGTIVVKPGQRSPRDNSTSGSVVTPGDAQVPRVSGSGHVLGSRSSENASLSAAEAARRKWSQTDQMSSVKNKTDSSSALSSHISDDHVLCPVCNKSLPPQAINKHLDSCLGSDDDMDDGDDDLLLAASIDVENSLTLDKPHEISDSDDDEPLIKRISTGSSRDNDVMTQQDDQDMLAALENDDVDDAEQSMFACPICDTLVTHELMFRHLDQCTQNI